jgi:hypothetical protein
VATPAYYRPSGSRHYGNAIYNTPARDGMSARNPNPLKVLLFAAIIVVWMILVVIGLVLYFLIKTGAIVDLA